MTSALLLASLAALAIASTWCLLAAVRRAPIGYETEEGFKAGAPVNAQDARNATAVAASRGRTRAAKPMSKRRVETELHGAHHASA